MRVKLRVEKKKEGREGVGCKTMMDSLQWNFRYRNPVYLFFPDSRNKLFVRLFICMYHNFRWML